MQSAAAQLAFSASVPGSRFLCSLDGRVFTECTSPVRLARLGDGRHRFEVLAVDPAGNVDATPARAEWTVVLPFQLSGGALSRWAPVLAHAVARAQPSPSARVVARLARRTPEGTHNLVLALERLEDASGRLWVRIRLPVLPNNRTGWVLRATLGGYTTVPTRLVVDRSRFTATLYRYGKSVWRARVGVGRGRWPTPRGEFYVRVKLAGFDDPFYGPIAFGLSARSAVLTDWPGGGFIGIHGTSLPQLLPGRVSHGCIRLRNADILRLARLMTVGTPVTIR